MVAKTRVLLGISLIGWRAELQVNTTPHMGGCQNYGPLLGPYYNTAPII